ncbi:group III truncated hemoglobin [Pleomorphomonas carboxyditropha]|uniref:Preprotein translocase subunit TatC n=1 Tax=Pleomorphomonas carboxyditropha TaxID=2023338 RepID=A0A2G9WUX3_9HYPH|nr:group III truncated hemoglobin [Pleomorphomonas carboxyditropha]PIO98112.1 hypothetical protein CJ014_17245 [Pleomorphomonas carboxyditropha]
MTATDAPRRGIPMGSIDEDNIRALVHGFYGKVMADPDLAAIFGREIEKNQWPAHLEKMCAFWSSVLLRSGRYDGRPMRPHLMIPDIEDRHFQRWLTLFAETARRVFDERDANGVIATAERIGHNFRLARAQNRGLDSTGLEMIRAEPAGDMA